MYEAQLSIIPMRNQISFYTDAEGCRVIPLVSIRKPSMIKPDKDGNIYIRVTVGPEEEDV